MEAYSSGRLEFLLLWRDGRVTPGWAICLVHLLSGGRWVFYRGALDALDASTGGDDEVWGLASLRTAFEGSHHPNGAIGKGFWTLA